jgi:hypothetical protein
MPRRASRASRLYEPQRLHCAWRCGPASLASACFLGSHPEHTSRNTLNRLSLHRGERNCVLGTTGTLAINLPALARLRGAWVSLVGQANFDSKNPEVFFDSSPTCGEIRSIVMKSSNGRRKILRRFRLNRCRISRAKDTRRIRGTLENPLSTLKSMVPAGGIEPTA